MQNDFCCPFSACIFCIFAFRTSGFKVNTHKYDIAVVLPLLNPGAQLQGCLLSLRDSGIRELIVLDACSNDGTAEMLNAFQAEFRVCIIREPDKGIYDAMNKGIAASSAEWLYFMGADDRLLPGGLAALAENIPEEYSMVYGNVLRMPGSKLYDGAFDLKKLFDRNICHQSALYRRSLFSEIGLFSNAYITLSDYAFNIQVFYRGFKTLHKPVTVAEFCETGRSAHFYDEAYWADYKINLIQPFTGVVDRHTLYGRIWKYFSYTLYARRKPFKAAYLWFYITLHQRDIKTSAGQVLQVIRKLSGLGK